MEPTIKILHLEDLKSDSDLINMELTKANIHFENRVVETKEEFILALKQFTPDIILADHSLSSFSSLEALKIVKENDANIPFLMVTTTVSNSVAANIVSEGAKELILKDNLDSLPAAVKKALDNIYLKEVDYPVTEILFEEEKGYNLRMLEEMDDNDYVAEIVSIFLKETPVELQKMKVASLANKANVVAEKAHMLKSNSGLLEANNLTGILEQVEAKAKLNSQPAELNRLVEAANTAYKKIESSLRDQLKALR